MASASGPQKPLGPIARIICGSLGNPGPVLLGALLLAAAGVWALRSLPIDALPDLSDTQVIIRTSYPGQAPRVVEDQVTYPLASAMLSVPRAATVRGYSLFGDSFIYVLFRDGTNPEQARAHVLESLVRSESRLPAQARPALEPDATGVGWIYEYALVDRSGRHDLAQLRALQDWTIKPELQAVDGVAEAATIGGLAKQYQVVVDPLRLQAQRITIGEVRAAIEAGNRASGGSVIELAEARYMVRATGYIASLDDLRRIPVKLGRGGVPVLLADIAELRFGPELRHGIADLDGEGEVVGGVVIMRRGYDSRSTIEAVKRRLQIIGASLPAGVQVVPTYDRSQLVGRVIDTLQRRLLEEMVLVLLVFLAFLLHVRSGVVLLVTLPLGMLGAFAVMRAQGLSANAMSLGGIAVAIGTMIDAAIVMVENVHRRLAEHGNPSGTRAALIARACVEVGPSLFVSLLIVALSFVPLLVLEGQEGRLFAPLAYTKTYAMVVAALLSITVVPVLISLLVRGRVRSGDESVVNRLLARAYRPALNFTLDHPWAVVFAALALVVLSLWPLARLETEFMPEMDEGDLLYMPATLPGISADAARALLQQTDRALRSVPEVAQVFGKAGRAETATDPAPLSMLETIIRLKPQSEWRPGLTRQALLAYLDQRVQLPGLANTWTAPIRARVDMQATGIRTAVGVKIVGPDLATIESIGIRIEEVLRGLARAAPVYSERVTAGRYVDIEVDRAAAARFGLSVADVHEVVALAVGGTIITQTVEGRERYPIILRYPRDWRDSIEQLRALPMVTGRGAVVALRDVAGVFVREGPEMIRSEDARLAGWVYVDLHDRDIAAFMSAARARIESARIVPVGYHLIWSGQYQALARAYARLRMVIPMTLGVIVLLLLANSRNLSDVLLALGPLPVALLGGVWILWAMGLRMSVATAVGFIALAGVAVETAVVTLLYLNGAWRERAGHGSVVGRAALRDAIVEGALLRLRPKMMTVATIIAGLIPLLLGHGAGFELMRRIAAPMVGGMLSATLFSLLLIPALYLLVHRRALAPGEAVPG